MPSRKSLIPLEPPSLTTTQRNNLSSVATGALIYNSTTGQYERYTGAAWRGIYEIGGTDASVADGGTGASDAATAAANLAVTPESGWTPLTATLSWSSMPTAGTSTNCGLAVIGTSSDLTGSWGIGDRLKLTHNSIVKKFIVVAITSSQITAISMVNQADLTNSAFSAPSMSHAKCPVGFSIDPADWQLILTDSSARQQTSPVSGTWYNLGSLSLSILIGAWRVLYEVQLQVVNTSSNTTGDQYVTLSTANNTESDAAMTGRLYQFGTVGSANQNLAVIHREKLLTLAATASYYLNSKTGTASTISSINFAGTIASTVIRAVSGYL